MKDEWEALAKALVQQAKAVANENYPSAQRLQKLVTAAAIAQDMVGKLK